MKLQVLAALAAFGILIAGFLDSSSAWGQTRPTGSTGGGTSMGATSGGGSSSGTFGSRTTGSGVSSGSRSFSGSGGGANAANMDPAGAGAGQITGNERFMRGNRQAGQFVGSDSGDAASFIGALTGGQNGGGLFGGLTGLTGGNNRRNNQANNGRNNNSTKKTMPVRVQVAFTHAALASGKVSAVLTRRLARVPTLSGLGLDLTGRTAVLRGLVATDHDRDLAEQLVRLEPGISVVQNDLLVVGPPTPGDTPPPESPALESAP